MEGSGQLGSQSQLPPPPSPSSVGEGFFFISFEVPPSDDPSSLSLTPSHGQSSYDGLTGSAEPFAGQYSNQSLRTFFCHRLIGQPGLSLKRLLVLMMGQAGGREPESSSPSCACDFTSCLVTPAASASAFMLGPAEPGLLLLLSWPTSKQDS